MNSEVTYYLALWLLTSWPGCCAGLSHTVYELRLESALPKGDKHHLIYINMPSNNSFPSPYFFFNYSIH